MIHPMFLRMSLSRCSGLSEGKDAILFDRLPQSFLLNRLRDEIDRTCENRLKPSAQSIEAPEIRKSAASRVLGQPHDDVDVRIGALIATRSRADQGDADDTGLL